MPETGDAPSPEFSIKDTHFRINKLPALEGWKTLEFIRKQVGESLDAEVLNLGAVMDSFSKVSGNGDQPAANPQHVAAIARVVFNLPVEFVEDLKRRLYSHIQFRNRIHASWSPLGESEEAAFVDLEFGDHYKVIGRALAVNFTESLRTLFD